MVLLLGGWSDDTEPEESTADGWLLPRLAVRSVAALGLLVALFVAVIHAFVDRYRRSTRE